MSRGSRAGISGWLAARDRFSVAPYPGYGLGAIDAFDGYIAYRLLDEDALANENAEMRALIERQYRSLTINQDHGLGMMLWLGHFFADENWAQAQTGRALAALDDLWVDPPGYFAGELCAPSPNCLCQLWRLARTAGRGALARTVLNGAKIRDFTYPRVWKATEGFPDNPKPTWRQRRILKKIPGIFRSL